MTSIVGAYDPFDHASIGELERLQALAEMSDPATQVLLASLVSPGWRCLDVGAGAGAVSVLLATLVGPAGKVVATDVDTRFLRPLATRGIEILEHDISAAPAAGPEFDLVIARFVLEWIPAREAALRHMLASVRPGGLLVVEGPDWGTRIEAAEPPELDTVIAAAVALVSAGGYEVDCGRRCPGRLEALGLEQVGGRTVSLLGRGGDTGPARWVRRSFDPVVPALLEQEMLSEAEVDVARKALADPRSRFWTPPTVAVWGWKSAD